MLESIIFHLYEFIVAIIVRLGPAVPAVMLACLSWRYTDAFTISVRKMVRFFICTTTFSGFTYLGLHDYSISDAMGYQSTDFSIKALSCGLFLAYTLEAVLWGSGESVPKRWGGEQSDKHEVTEQ